VRDIFMVKKSKFFEKIKQRNNMVETKKDYKPSSYFLRKTPDRSQVKNEEINIFADHDSSNSPVTEYDYLDKTIMGDERNRTLFDLSPQAIVFVNSQGILLDANRKLYEWLGYKPEEIIGKNIFDLPFLPKKSKDIIRDNFFLRLKGENPPPYEVEFLHRNGSIKWGEIHGALLQDPAKKLVFDLVMVSDITERKNMIDALQQSEEQYRTLFENANDLIQSVDAEGKFIEVNPKWLRTLEYAREDVEQLRLSDILRQDQIPHCIKLFNQVIAGESLKHIKTVFLTKTGKQIFVEGSANGYFKDDKFIATVGIFREISNKRGD